MQRRAEKAEVNFIIHFVLVFNFSAHYKSTETLHLCLKILDRPKDASGWQLKGCCRLEMLWEAWTARSCAHMLQGGSLSLEAAEGQQLPSWIIGLRKPPALPTVLGTAGSWGPTCSHQLACCRPASSWHHFQNNVILQAVLVGFSWEQCLQQLRRVAGDCGSPLHSEYSWQTLQRTQRHRCPGIAQTSSKYSHQNSDFKKPQRSCG